MKELQSKLDESNAKNESLQDEVIRIRSIADRFMVSFEKL